MDDQGLSATERVSLRLRLEQSDGTTVEFAWDDSGEVTTKRRGKGPAAGDEQTGAFRDSGAFVRTDEAIEEAQTASAYGKSTETSRYDDGTVVEHGYDDDARLRRVSIRGLWGEQTMELWPDGSRELTWAVGSLRGERRWDAAGKSSRSVRVAERGD